MKDKVSKLVSGIVVLVLGILIAIFGAQTVLDVYFGVVCLVCAAALLVLGIITLVKKEKLEMTTPVTFAVLVAVGVGLLTSYLTVDALIWFLVLVILGAGAGLILYGVYLIVKKEVVKGVVDIVIGAAAIVLSALYMAVEDFRTVFWIIVGVLVALYGLLLMVLAIIDMTKKSSK